MKTFRAALVAILAGCVSGQYYTINSVVGSHQPFTAFQGGLYNQPRVIQQVNPTPLRAGFYRVQAQHHPRTQQAGYRARLPIRTIARVQPQVLIQQAVPVTRTTSQQLVNPTTQTPQLSLEGNPEEIVNTIITETSVQGEKILKSVRTLIKNPLIAKLLASNADNTDPCAVIPSNLDVITQNLIDGVTSSRTELVAIIRLVQSMKAAGNETVQVLRYSSDAVKLMAPLIPKFSKVFKANEGCDASIQTTIKSLNNVGNVLTTLGNTNIVAKDDYTKTRFIQGGEASRIIGRVTESLERSKFTNLCSNSPTFTSDVFSGVGEILGGLNDVAKAFNAESEAINDGQLDNTVTLLKEGANLLTDLNLPNAGGETIPAFSSTCTISIPAVSRALGEVADIVEVLDTSSFSK